MAGKHAYLIMDGGNNLVQLQQLINTLDDSRNDIYLHIDKKSPCSDHDLKQKLSAKHAGFILVPRMKVYWGGYSLVACELRLLKAAHQNYEYEYYHLLSGQDLPLQSQDYIHKFMSEHKGYEFINFDDRKLQTYRQIRERVSHYHICSDVSFRRYHTTIGIFFAKALRKLEEISQRLLKIDKYKNKVIKYGSQWFSIDDDLAKYVIAHEKNIEKQFKNTILCDELFLQTLVYTNENFRQRLYPKNDGNLRYINWDLGLPFTWNSAHFNMLEEASKKGYLFARKFNSVEDQSVIWQVIKELL
ncbi:hypothetical protein ME800_12270 [Lactobacillus delbrueckii]|uniref:beta-1,6-N-acetylglucosaminyltransferase n=1 Tax=Lactobacillus delbrueckii TaxID=1584 RepID=UPI001F22D0B3|nr:beta-1,6-N-acetylglucosaminyltransferase [Lactobacillus delbrueckii]GHN49618.1 hypothetical protein ME800_12270 [Lactobacillus delbrueckii]